MFRANCVRHQDKDSRRLCCMVALQMRNQSVGNIIATHALTKEAVFNSAWDKGDLSDIPRQLPQRTGEDCAICSSFWFLAVLWHTYTLLMPLLLSLVFPCVEWKATAFIAGPVTILWKYFHFPFSPWCICLCPAKQTNRRAASSDSEGCRMPQAAFPEGASMKVSLARHADGLRHALPASQKIWNLNEGNAGLPPAPASLRDVDGVSQWWAALAASSLQSLGRSPSHREKLKPSSYSSPECWGGQRRMTFSSGLRSNSLVGLSCFEIEASPSPGAPSLPSFEWTCKRLKSSTAW